MTPQVTVAVVVKDRRERMSRCLDALLAQDHDSFEILVCDNGSTDGTVAMVRERAAGASVGCDAGGSGSPLMPTTATASLAYFSDSFWMCGIDMMHGPQ